MTISSDANQSSPITRLKELRRCMESKVLPLERLISLVTSNIARVLKLESKGSLEKGKDADLLILDRDLIVQDLFANGKRIVCKGEPQALESYLPKTDRIVAFRGGSNPG